MLVLDLIASVVFSYVPAVTLFSIFLSYLFNLLNMGAPSGIIELANAINVRNARALYASNPIFSKSKEEKRKERLQRIAKYLSKLEPETEGTEI